MNILNISSTSLKIETTGEIAERILSPRLNKVTEEEKRELIVSAIVTILTKGKANVTYTPTGTHKESK